MSRDRGRHRYDVFGLTVEAPFDFRLLQPAISATEADVQVTLAPVAPSLCTTLVEKYVPMQQAHIAIGTSGEVLWRTEYGRFLAIEGNRVIVDLETPGGKLGAVRRFLVSNCLPAILAQRGAVALHASSIAMRGGAVTFAGQSGAGKSTLLAALMARGNAMISDDVTALRAGDKAIEVAPGFPTIRLCRDAVGKVPLQSTRPPRAIGGVRDKLAVDTSRESFERRCLPLRAIYLLESHESDTVVVDKLAGLQKLAALRMHCYPPASLIRLPQFFATFAALAAEVAVYRIRRPLTKWTLEEVVEVVAQRHAIEPTQHAA